MTDTEQEIIDLVEVNISRWQTYPEYRSSDVEWLGEVPAHWGAIRVKMLCLVKRGASPRPIDDPMYFDDQGEYAWVRISDVTASDKYLMVTEQKLSPLGKSKSVALELGELFLSIAASVGKPIITKIKCCVHDGFVYFQGLKQNREFLYYVFSGGELYKGLGKLGTQLNLNTETVGNIVVPLPPLSEQHIIAAFLDRETAHIDALITKKRELIALLQEQRSAFISHAVTKGLNPDAPMKESGIGWLGEVPAHWKTIRSKRLFSVRNERATDGDQQLSATQAYGVIPQEEFERRVGRQVVKIIKNLEQRSYVEKDDFVISMRSFQGGLERAWARGCIRSSYVVLKPTLSVDVDFFMYLFKSASYIQALQATADFIRDGQDLTFRNFSLVDLPIIPIDEQRAIAGYLSRATSEIDQLIEKTTETIACLQEYRSALISAAVTGKIDVRGEVESW